MNEPTITAPAVGDLQRRCWTITPAADGATAQCRLYNGHEGTCLFRDVAHECALDDGWPSDFSCYCPRSSKEACWAHPHRYVAPGEELGHIACQPHGHDARLGAAGERAER